MKIMQMLSTFHNFPGINPTRVFAAEIDWSLIYILLTLTTTLLCTLLIIYRIVCHAPEISTSQKIIEILIQSSAITSLSLIVYLALVSRNSESGFYADMIAAYIRVSFHWVPFVLRFDTFKAIAPTLLVGRVSAHANAILQRQKMVVMWENHPPLVGCFREEDTNNSHDDGHQTSSGSSSKETV